MNTIKWNVGGIIIRFLKTIYGSVGASYIIKQYLFLCILILIFMVAVSDFVTEADLIAMRDIQFGVGDIKYLVYLGSATILYPFAMYGIDSILRMLFGNFSLWISVFLIPIILLIMIAKIAIVFATAPFTAPIVIIYLYIVNKNNV